MPMFRARPAAVEAVQLLPETYDETLALVARAPGCAIGQIYGDDAQWQVTIMTPTGVLYGTKGDWLIRDAGGLDIIPDASFRAIYEPAGSLELGTVEAK